VLTIFSCPKFFRGHFGVIQRNAIKSWTLLDPKPEILLFGDDEGTANVCAELGVRHLPEVRRNVHGTPLLSSIFEGASKAASHTLLCYLNSDILLLDDFARAVERVPSERSMLSCRRWDLDVRGPIVFDEGWQIALRERVRRKGILHGYSGIDLLVFPREVKHGMPEFSIGRVGWDNWFLWKAQMSGYRIVDATDDITIVHQQHDFSHSVHGVRGRVEGPEPLRNISLAGGYEKMRTLRDADDLLRNGRLCRPSLTRRIAKYLCATTIGTALVSFKRRLSAGL